MNQKIRSFLVLIGLGVFSLSLFAEEPKGEKIASQSFKANFKYFKNIEFASFSDSSSGIDKVRFYLLRDKEIVVKLPDVYGSMGWSFWEVTAISFKDLNFDGLKDIIIMAQYMTGIGPTGSRPFYVKDVFFQDKNGFTKREALTKLLNEDRNYEKLKTIKSIRSYVKKQFKKE